jgi:hypothetical protein
LTTDVMCSNCTPTPAAMCDERCGRTEEMELAGGEGESVAP